MRKRLIEKFTKAKEGSFGYTMTELLVVVAIIAIVAAIAIPSVIAISRALKFKRVNDHAKSIFLAAQQNLTEMRSDGGLKPLRSAGGSVLTNIAGFPEEYKTEYLYTSNASANTAFELILPAGSVDGTVRAEQIIIEYNPITGNVYSVFYSEEDESILGEYQSQDGLPRNADGDKSRRKDMMLGYYDGSGLNSSQLEIEESQAMVEFVNGEEGIVRVLVPVPDDYFSNVNEYAQALKIDLTITGEYSMLHGVQGAAETGGEAADPSATTGGTAATVPAVTIEIKNFGTGLSENVYVEYGNVIVVEYPIDSLMDKSSFANYAAESRGSTLTNLMDESSFKVLPGENVTIQADVEMDSGSGDLDVVIEPGILSSVNPMFDFLQPSGDGGYILAVSNGRNLQNLNAIAPTIAELVDAVVFTDDIYWNKTVAYYNDVYGNGDNAFSNLADEAPARALPYFVPIHNENLFGTAKFIFPGDGDGDLGSDLDKWLKELREALAALGEVIFGGFNNPKVPTLTDEMDAVNDAVHASIQGNGHKVYNLNIDSNAYVVPHDVEDVETATDAELAKLGKFYAVGENQVVDYYFTGLFGYVNTPIENLHIVNPIIKGHAFDDDASPVYKQTRVWNSEKRRWEWVSELVGYSYQYTNPATGALVGVCGYNTVITNCSTYIDRDSASFIDAYLVHGDFNKDAAQKWYGVSGEGAVGGLVGYAKSHRSVKGALTNNSAHIAFSNSFAAVAVSGNMRPLSAASTDFNGNSNDAGKDFGYSNGVGGFIGNSQLTNFYNCYASGDVKANNSVLCQTQLGAAGNWIRRLIDWTASIINVNLLEGVMDAIPELLYNGRTSWGAGGFVGTSHGTCYTNCFATGDINATCNVANRGAGGFVGFMSLDETSAYGNDALKTDGTTVSGNAQIAQRTVFSSCYAVGLATSGEGNENFSGGDGRIVYDLDESLAYLYGDYYLTYAHTYHANGTAPEYGNSSYFYKDTYYLNYGRHTADIQPTKCGKSEGYETLQNLPVAHAYNSTLARRRLTELEGTYTFKKNNSILLPYYITTYQRGFFDVYEDLRGLYLTAYASGFSDVAWEPASEQTTHPYTLGASGAVYPFSKLKNLDYYGDWPSKPSGMGMAYYEQYVGDQVNSYFVFDKERPGVNERLALKDTETTVVSKDGYAIFSVGQTALTVTVGNETFTIAEPSKYSFVIDNKPYYVFFLPDEALDVKPAQGEFYVQVTAKHATGDTFTMYFNPDVALSHVNPTDKAVAATKPTTTPKTIYVRSARQFKALSTLQNFWTQDYRYIQQLNIDATQYDGWEDADDRLVASIGNAQKKFDASYTAAYTNDLGVAKQHSITGFQFANNASGFFGVIGENGTVEELIVNGDKLTVNTSDADAAVLAGRNEGTISNVDMVLENLTTLTAADNAGLLAGYSSGTVRDCEVSAAAVTVNAKNGGGLIGSVEGTANAKAKVSGCKLTLTGDLTVTGTGNAGGLIGNAEHLSLTAGEPLVSLKKVTATGENAGGLIGCAKDTDIKITDADNAVTVTADSITNSNGTAAGVLGGGKTVTLNSVDVEIGSVSGDVAAGFLDSGTDIDVSYCDVEVFGTIQGKTEAAGVAGTIGSQSVFNLCTVTLTDVTVSATAGNAAGYAVEIAAEAEIRNSSVTLGGSAKIEASNNAAGYACTVAGYVGNASGSAVSSSVVGEGTITGKNAAGFACDITGQVASSFVTPALAATKDAYKATNNSKLNVKATGTGEGEGKAAGFALTVGEDATVTNCYALNQITGDSMTGFVGINKGSIDRCMANVTIPGGNAFVATNDGTVTRCYGWYGDGDPSKTETNAKVGGNVYSAYFVDLNPVDKEGKIVVLYTPKGEQKEMTATELQGSIDILAGDGFTWYKPDVAGGYESYPYTAMPENMPKYLYPMLRDHYGDWILPPQYAYGVAYYEIHSVPSTVAEVAEGETTQPTTVKLHMVDLSDEKVTEEGENGKRANYTDTFDNTGTIVKTGYAVFSKSGVNVLSSYAGEKLADLTYTLKLNDSKSVTYDFYELKTDSAKDGVVTIGATAVSKNTAAVQTWFADAINVTDNTYRVRTPEQLANVAQTAAASFNFSQTHDIAVTDFTTVEKLSGNYAGNDLKLSVSGQTKTWMSTVDGTVLNLNLEIPNGVNAPVFGTVSQGANVTLSGLKIGAVGAKGALATTVDGTMTVPAISTPAVSGKLFGDSDGTINTDAITVGTTDADGKWIPGAVAQLFGDVANVTVNGAIETGTVSGKLFGDGAGTVSTGTINVTGTVAQVFGNVTGGSVTVTSINTNGNAVSGNVFGNVSAPVTVTYGITTSDGKETPSYGTVSGNVFGAIDMGAGEAVQVGGITVGNVTNTLVYSINTAAAEGEKAAGSVSLGAVSTQAIVTPAQGETAAKPVNLFGAISGSGTVTVASINTNGNAVNGNVFGEINGTVNVGTVDTAGNFTGGPITTGAVTGNIFTEITGGTVTTGAITAGDVTGNVFGTVGGTVTTGAINVASLNGKLATTVGGTLQGSAAGTAVNIGKDGTANLTQDLVGTVSGSLKNYAVKAADVSASVVGTLGENGAVTSVSITADSAGNAPVLVKSNGGNIVSCTVEVASVEATGAAAPYGVMADQVKAGKKIESSFVKVGTLTIDGNTAQFGALVGTNAGALTGNTVDSNEADKSLALNVTGVNGKEPVIGGLVGTNASTGTISGGTVDVAITYTQSNITDDQGNVTATDKGATIGGLVGENSGTIGVAKTVTQVKGAVNLTKKNDGQSRAYIIGGAVGKDAGTAEKPATYSNVSTTVAIDENWAGAKLVNTSVAKYLAETDADAIAAICPASFGPVGKFVGYVGGGSFNNCSAVGSKTTKAYQFLGEIKPDTAELQQDSLYLSVADYKDSFPLESAPNLCAPGVTKAWTEWVAETILKAEDDYRVFGITLNNCSFDLPDGNVANQVYKPNYDFYKLDNYTEVKLFKSGGKVENNILFTPDAEITADSLYDAYKPDSKDEKQTTNSVDTAEYNCYYKDEVTYKKVTSLEVTVERSKFIMWWIENKHTIALKNGTDTLVSVSRTSNGGSRWSSWGTMDSVYTVSETVPSDTSYVLLSEDGTKMMAVVGGVATSVDVSASFAESDGYLWKRVNGTFTSATYASVTLSATFDLAANSYNSTTQAYVIGGVPYYLHAYTEASHGYTATFVPSGESNMVCGYNVVPAAPAALSEETIPAEEIGGETGNNT